MRRGIAALLLLLGLVLALAGARPAFLALSPFAASPVVLAFVAVLSRGCSW